VSDPSTTRTQLHVLAHDFRSAAIAGSMNMPNFWPPRLWAFLAEAAGLLIKTLRELSRLEWLKVVFPGCGRGMTWYLTSQEEVEEALAKGVLLETICSYCQNRIRLDAGMFEPMI